LLLLLSRSSPPALLPPVTIVDAVAVAVRHCGLFCCRVAVVAVAIIAVAVVVVAIAANISAAAVVIVI
jgi:hypothetical protein